MKNNNTKYKLLIILSFAGIFLSSCNVVKYSFTGADVPLSVQTVSVKYFPNNASLVQPTLSQALTEALKEKFINQTRLIIVDDEGDLNFEGAITNYDTKPMSIQADETAAMNRLTVTIKVDYTNSKIEEQDFSKTFSAFSEYDSSKSLEEVEEGLLDEIIEQLVDDIFNQALVNW